jgi:hypothetical protein
VTYLFVIFLFVGTWAMLAIIGGERQRRIDDLHTRKQIQHQVDDRSLPMHTGKSESGSSGRKAA